ncbi:MAG: ABC transporter permease subunit [Sphaerochaeta sp.]|jgi:putative aldouronate transport system permease protein|nr:ABC transporter permease subunit [Sphaerochaeta sp.]
MKKRLYQRVWDKRGLFLLMAIPFAWYIIFKYVPMYGVQLAFKRYNPALGITRSPWVGLKYFRQFFHSYYFGTLLWNTLSLSLFQMLIGFPLPIILALMINEIHVRPYQKLVQNVTYIPHFLSTVVVVSMLNLFCDPTYGIFNKYLGLFGVPATDYMAKPNAFQTLYVFSNVWQNMGFNSIIYIAVLSSLNQDMYEAAMIDGCSRFKQMIYISLPALLPTIMILFVMRVGSLMNIGFEKVLLMQNPVNMSRSNVIATFVYTNGIQQGEFSYSTAIGLFNSLTNFVLLFGANRFSKKLTGSSLW